jgi:hypothetical protein
MKAAEYVLVSGRPTKAHLEAGKGLRETVAAQMTP